MLSSWVFFSFFLFLPAASRHVNLPPMRGEAPIQLRETHKGKRQRTEATLKICSQDKDRVSVSDPLLNKLIFQHRQLPVGSENTARKEEF